ncbi:hypothetical protein RJ640_003136 [Escallonia rubra]|uniref:J domain-containing protein n=1 Tax=Escallonia rubra TaxID=112253 RepID=A0AA88RSG5_9ASTE|nr:hypothetical protein RJ640_003136 [Escallonia rubra]
MDDLLRKIRADCRQDVSGVMDDLLTKSMWAWEAKPRLMHDLSRDVKADNLDKCMDVLGLVDNLITKSKWLSWNDKIRVKIDLYSKAREDEKRPLVVGYISGASPKSKLFWLCHKKALFKMFQCVSADGGFKKIMNYGGQIVKALDKMIENETHEALEADEYKACTMSNGNCRGIQMLHLPERFELLLSLPTDAKDAPKAEESKLVMEEENGTTPLFSPGGDNVAKTLPIRSRANSLDSGNDCDDWVMCQYKVFGLGGHCTADEICSAYRRLALQHHPDKLAQFGISPATYRRPALQAYQTSPFP